MDENKNILADVQEMIVKRLNEDSVLSGNCTFIAENRKTVDFEIKNALGRQGIVGLVLTPTATYAGKYEDLYLAWQLDDLEIDIVENPTVNRGKRGDYMTGQDVSMRVFDVLCPMTGEKEGEFCPTSYQQGEDEGLLVNKCTFKTLVYGDHGDTPTPDEPITFKFVKLLDEPPADGVQLKDGWMWKQGGKMYLCAGQEIKVLGGVQEDEMSAYVESQVSSKADLSVFENECWKKDDAVISAGIGFTTQGFNSVSDDWGEDFLFGDGAAITNYNSSGALILEDRMVTSKTLYDTAIITPRGIRQISKRGDDEPVIHGTLMFPRNDSEFTNLATEKWVEGQISSKADLSALSSKADLSAFDDYAKIDELSTKADLSALSSKSDLSSLASYLSLSAYRTDISAKADLSALPSKTSQLTNDSGFITSAQVEPSTTYGMNGYAANSDYATRLKALDTGTTLPTGRGTIIPTFTYDSATNTYTLDLYGSVGGYYPWILHRLFGTDFSPAITLEWRKGSIYRKRVIGGRVIWAVTYNNNWMWLAKGKYAITCPTGDGNPDGKFYVLNYEDETHPNYINDPATDVHTITYNKNNITSIDGQAGGETSQAIWCYRTNDNPIAIWERPFAYRNELSAKADLSALSSKADLSSLYDYAKIDELSAKADLSSLASYLPLSGGTLSGTLNAQAVYGSQFTTNSECQTGGGQTYASFGNNGILLGRSPDLLRVLWPFDQELGRNQTFATQEWVGWQISSKADISALNLALDRLATKAKYSDNTVSSFLFIGDTPEIFPNRDNVVEVELGLGVSAIGLFTFNGATRLKSVKCNEGLVEIKGGSFSGCTSLSSINFPSTLTAIYGSGAIFGNCRSLHDLDFPESLKSISQYCFLDAPISSAIFRGKTMEQVSAMANYPWAIQRSAIHTWNVATQEWVLQQLSALQQ